MKLHFISAHQKIGPMRKTLGLEDGSNRSYPMAAKITSMEEEVSDLHSYRDVLLKHADAGHALYKGLFQKPLSNESRRGKTDKEAKTEFIVLDIDGLTIDSYKAGACGSADVKAVAESVVKMLPKTVHDVSYVAVASSSFGIKDKEVSVHIHFLLNSPAESRAIKEWLVSLNYTQGKIFDKLKLTPSRMRIKSIVDPCLAEPARVVYICPPQFGPRITNPFADNAERVVVVEKGEPTLDLERELEAMAAKKEIIDERKASKLIDLQKKAGVSTAKLKKTKINVQGNELYVVSNPPESRMEFAYDDDEFVRYNIAGKQNNAYWVPRNNPEIVYSFIPDEPNFMFKHADPEAYRRHVSKYGEAFEEMKDETTGQTRKIARNLYIDQETDAFVSVEHDIESDEIVNIAERRNIVVAEHWLKHYGKTMPDPIPAVHVVSNPEDMRTRYAIGDKEYLNRFLPTPYMRDQVEYPFAHEARYGNAWLLHLECPVLCEIMLHMLGDDMECFEHFINWLAFIFQKKNKAETAWMIHGTEGTGKGLFFKKVLRVLFSNKYARQNTLQGIADDQFNGWMEDTIILMVDEFNMKGTNSLTKTASLLKTLITEPTMMVRKMQQMQREIVQRLNFIFATNDLDALSGNDKRRFNIAPRQMRDLEARLDYVKKYRTTTDEMIEAELATFARFLTSFKINQRQVNTIIENKARLDAQQAGMTAVDKFFENLRTGNFGDFVHVLDKPSVNVDPVEQLKITRAKTFLTANLQHVNTNKPCYLHKDDLRSLYGFLAGKEISENAFGRMMSTHEIITKRKPDPVGYVQKLSTRPWCVEVQWEYDDLATLEILKKNNITVPRGNVEPIDKNKEDREKLMKEARERLKGDNS